MVNENLEFGSEIERSTDEFARFLFGVLPLAASAIAVFVGAVTVGRARGARRTRIQSFCS